MIVPSRSSGGSGSRPEFVRLLTHAMRLAKRKALVWFARQFAVLPSGRGPILPASFSEAFESVLL